MKHSFDAPAQRFICWNEDDPSKQVTVTMAEAIAALGDSASSYVGSLMPVIEQEVRKIAEQRFLDEQTDKPAKKLKAHVPE